MQEAEKSEKAFLSSRLASLMSGKAKTPVELVETRLICPNPAHKPKKYPFREIRAMYDSIIDKGFQSPITVIRIVPPEAQRGGKPSLNNDCFYQLVSGEKRFRASLFGDFMYVPCVVIGEVRSAVTPKDGAKPQPRLPSQEQPRGRKISINDPGMFYNTISHYVSMMRESGYDIAYEKLERPAFTELSIRVAKRR